MFGTRSVAPTPQGEARGTAAAPDAELASNELVIVIQRPPPPETFGFAVLGGADKRMREVFVRKLIAGSRAEQAGLMVSDGVSE
jgi:hypothetical protein